MFLKNVNKLYSGKVQTKLCSYIIFNFYYVIKVATGLMTQMIGKLFWYLAYLEEIGNFYKTNIFLLKQ